MIRKITTFTIGLSVALIAIAQEPVEPTDSLTRELQEVVVQAKQPATKLVGSSLVSTIAGSNLQNLGNAYDVMRQLPLINIDQDEKISVTGRGEPEIFINGRPLRDGIELRHLKSTNIREIELVMAPGAQYSSTTHAVIKITTKRNPIEGLSIDEEANSQWRRNWSGYEDLQLGYHWDNFDMFVDGAAAHNNSHIKGSTINQLNYKGKETVVGASQDKQFPTNTWSVNPGFNYSKGNLSFGGYYKYNHEHGDFSNLGSEWFNNEQPIVRNIESLIRAHTHRASLYYDQRFSESYHLHFDGDFRQSKSNQDDATVYSDPDFSNVNSTQKRNSTLWAGKLYLDFPLAGGLLTVGTQDSYTHTKLDYQMLNSEVGQYIPSSLTDAKQTSLAAFAMWERSFGAFNLSAGLRYEYIDYLFFSNGIKDKDVSRTDNLLTPDISLGYSFNDYSMINLSYRMTTVKPPYSQLTRGLTYTGLHEIEGGNPALRDEKLHDIQLLCQWKEFMFVADYQRSLDTYGFVKQLYDASTLQLLMHPINMDVPMLTSYIIWSRPIKSWTPDITAGMQKQWLTIYGVNHNKPQFFYTVQNTLSIPGGFTITANINGQSSGDMHTNRFSASWFVMDMGIRKTFFNKSLAVKLQATDIFNTRNNDWSMYTYGIQVIKNQTYDSRGISLNVTYSFQSRPNRYKGKAASADELNRL